MTIDWSRMITPEEQAAAELAAARTAAADRLTGMLDARARAITGEVPVAEMASWPAKEAAARAHLAGTADTPALAMLAAETSLTGEATADLATRIVANADAYRLAAAHLAGLRRATLAAIAAAATPEAVAEVLARLR